MPERTDVEIVRREFQKELETVKGAIIEVYDRLDMLKEEIISLQKKK